MKKHKTCVLAFFVAALCVPNTAAAHICSVPDIWFYHYQTVAAGGLAVLAAMITAIVIWKQGRSQRTYDMQMRILEKYYLRLGVATMLRAEINMRAKQLDAIDIKTVAEKLDKNPDDHAISLVSFSAMEQPYLIAYETHVKNMSQMSHHAIRPTMKFYATIMGVLDGMKAVNQALALSESSNKEKAAMLRNVMDRIDAAKTAAGYALPPLAHEMKEMERLISHFLTNFNNLAGNFREAKKLAAQQATERTKKEENHHG